MTIPQIWALLALAASAIWLALVLRIERWRRRSRLAGSSIVAAGDHGAVDRGAEGLPKVSVLVAVRNEEEHVEATVRGLLASTYPDIEIIVVNDRSTDRTGSILERLEKENPGRVVVVAVDDLPEDWLGKCHALYVGAPYATGSWLLFTDADVAFAPDAIDTAVATATARHADHFVLFPRLLWEGHVEAALLAFFTMMLGIGFRLWEVESRSLKAFVGIGAFNMIRRDLYARIGGHERLRMEIADDMMLGYLAKRHGGRSVAADSRGLVRVRWRQGALDIVRGLVRSSFAGVDFSWVKTGGSFIFLLGFVIAPYALPFIEPSSATITLSLSAILAMLGAQWLTARSQQMPASATLLYPVAAILFAFGSTASALLATFRGGVWWRGTFYPIGRLRAGRVRR